MEGLIFFAPIWVFMVGIGLAIDKWFFVKRNGTFPWEDVSDGDKPAKHVPLNEQFRKYPQMPKSTAREGASR